MSPRASDDPPILDALADQRGLIGKKRIIQRRKKVCLFDHLVGAGEKCGWDSKAQRLGSPAGTIATVPKSSALRSKWGPSICSKAWPEVSYSIISSART